MESPLNTVVSQSASYVDGECADNIRMSRCTTRLLDDKCSRRCLLSFIVHHCAHPAGGIVERGGKSCVARDPREPHDGVLLERTERRQHPQPARHGLSLPDFLRRSLGSTKGGVDVQIATSAPHAQNRHQVTLLLEVHSGGQHVNHCTDAIVQETVYPVGPRRDATLLERGALTCHRLTDEIRELGIIPYVLPGLLGGRELCAVLRIRHSSAKLTPRENRKEETKSRAILQRRVRKERTCFVH